jgi:hypothetical protein
MFGLQAHSEILGSIWQTKLRDLQLDLEAVDMLATRNSSTCEGDDKLRDHTKNTKQEH